MITRQQLFEVYALSLLIMIVFVCIEYPGVAPLS